MILAFAKRLEQALGLMARWCCALAACALSLIVVIIVVSVVMRRVAGSPMYYSEELVGLLLSSSLFLALPLVTAQASHVRVTFLANFLPERGRAALAVFASIVMLGFCGWYLLDAMPWLEFAFRRNIKSEAASLLLAPWMAVLPLSLSLCAMLVLVRLVTGSEKSTFDKAKIGH